MFAATIFFFFKFWLDFGNPSIISLSPDDAFLLTYDWLRKACFSLHRRWSLWAANGVVDLLGSSVQAGWQRDQTFWSTLWAPCTGQQSGWPFSRAPDRLLQPRSFYRIACFWFILHCHRRCCSDTSCYPEPNVVLIPSINIPFEHVLVLQPTLLYSQQSKAVGSDN